MEFVERELGRRCRPAREPGAVLPAADPAAARELGAARGVLHAVQHVRNIRMAILNATKDVPGPQNLEAKAPKISGSARVRW